jgi:hypothetical protein
MTMTEITNQAAPSETRVHQLWNRYWPPAIIGVGFALTASWIFFLGYGFVKLMLVAVFPSALKIFVGEI